MPYSRDTSASLGRWAAASTKAWKRRSSASMRAVHGDLSETEDAPPVPYASALELLKAHLAQLSAAASSVVLADYEARPEAEVGELTARAELLAQTALEALDLVEVLYVDIHRQEIAREETATPDSGNELDARASMPPIEAVSIEDVLMLARMGLRSRVRLLRAAAHRPHLTRLSVTGATLRAVVKSLSAVDRAVSEAEHALPSLRFHESALSSSLEVRERYADLWRFVLRGGEPELPFVRDRLLSVSAALSRTLGLPVAIHFRTDDRALLLMARARIREWLLLRDDSLDHLREGLHLFQDVAATVTMFTEVNRREELLQHDAQLVRDVLPDVPRGALLWSTDKRASVLRRLTAMRGRSPALDALLDLPTEAVAARDLRPILEELDDMLAGVTLLDPA